MTDFAKAAALAQQQSGHAVRLEAEGAFSPALRAARFRLENGLRVVFLPDFRAPIFAYQTWFKVGSKDEEPTRTGLAHLFEHLMFKGTRTHAAGVFDREMERRGTQTNAATWVDWTFYHQALAARADNFQTVIDFEADRMTGLVLDETTFRSELEVVKNERRMSVEDSVFGSMNEHLFAHAYAKHPYRWPTIGSMAHLEATTLADLERFYRTYYAPNNAVVVVAGALEPEEALPLIAKRYGGLASQPIQRQAITAEPPQRQARLLRLEKPVATTQMAVAYHAPAQLDPAFDALEVWSDALVSGDTARLYRRLVTEEQVATEVDGALMPFADPGLYEIFVNLRPEVDPLAVLDIIQEELDRLPQGLAPEETDKAKNGLELSFVEGWRAAEGAAEALGHFEVNYDNFGLAFTGLERLARIDEKLLAETAAKTFRADNRTVVIADPARGEEAGEEPS